MTYKVYMFAFQIEQNGPDIIREVTVPDHLEQCLENIFIHGQNEVQNVPNKCSVSVGDVVEFENGLYLVNPISFTPITVDKMEKLRRMSHRDRAFYGYEKEEE